MTNITNIHDSTRIDPAALDGPNDSEAFPATMQGELRDLHELFTALHVWAGIAGDSADPRILHALNFTAEVYAIRGVQILIRLHLWFYGDEPETLESRNTPVEDLID